MFTRKEAIRTHELDSQVKKDHKNARSSHQEPTPKSGKMGLYAHNARTHANKELLDDALDLAESQTSSYSPR